MEFVQVPRQMIEDLTLSDKRVLAYCTAYFSRWSGGRIDDLVRRCGYSPENRHSGSAGKQIESAISSMMKMRYFEIVCGHFRCPPMRDCFGVVYIDEYEQIMKSRTSGEMGTAANPAHLLLLLSCIRCHMLHVKGKPQVYSNLLKRISERIGISVRSVSNCVRVLEAMEIIHSEELPRYKDNKGCWHSNVRIFVNRRDRMNADNTYDWQRETKRGILMIRADQQC